MRMRPVALALVAFASLGLVSSERFVGRVVSVDDGDTVKMIKEGYASRVRLEGIDGPERGQPFSQRARARTAELLLGKTAEATVLTTDLYGRLVARLRVGSLDVSETLVREGLAWHFKKHSADQALAAAEAAARKGRLGLWSESNPIPPWEWRRPLQQVSRNVPQTLTGTGGRHAEVVDAGEPHRPFHGNARSRVFHTASCKNYLCVNCTRIFKSEEEAKAAGYRPAGCCHR